MTKTAQDITMYVGETVNINVTVYDGDNGGNMSLVGSTIRWAMYSQNEAGVLLTKTTSSGITITDAANGLFTIAISPTDTTALTPGNYSHEARATDASGNISQLLTGDFILLDNRA